MIRRTTYFEQFGLVPRTGVFSETKRSEIMARVKNKNTRPELVVRSLLHAMGYRYRLHRRDLPGSPDIVLPKYRAVIFVHGCFWHGHAGCGRAKRPRANAAFWNEKIDRNIVRDSEVRAALVAAGWHVCVVWQCTTRDIERLSAELQAFLHNSAVEEADALACRGKQ